MCGQLERWSLSDVARGRSSRTVHTHRRLRAAASRLAPVLGVDASLHLSSCYGLSYYGLVAVLLLRRAALTDPTAPPARASTARHGPCSSRRSTGVAAA